MNYNTELKRLILPEYGRNIHNMVAYCVSLPSKDARQKCALSIISTMGSLFPHLRDISDFKHILWDHLAIMSDFKLDIDYPYEVIRKEDLYSKPPKVPYGNSRFSYRHYGRITEKMIDVAVSMEEGEEQYRLVSLLANFMKRSYVTWNKDTVENVKILSDLYDLSGGRFNIAEEDIRLIESSELISQAAENAPQQPQPGKKKKKKNKNK
jgi:hypothetical protein